MPGSNDHHLQEVAILTRSVENVFRKLIRFLVGRISLVKLQEMLRFIYVEEAENKIREENPEKNIPLTKLALLSGLDTRTLIKIRNSKSFRQPLHGDKSFLKDLTPSASILDVWSSKAPYCDESKGKPKKLNVTGSEKSFEALFNETVSNRGVTASSLLNRLVESGSVILDRNSDTVEMIRLSYLPSTSNDELGAIEMGFSAIANLVDTVSRNIKMIDNEEEKFYQRGVWAFRLSPSNCSELRNRIRELLSDTDAQARKVLRKFDDRVANPSQITAGVSMFYFEEGDF